MHSEVTNTSIILLLCDGNPEEFFELKRILNIYSLVTRMRFDLSKSCFLFNVLFDNTLANLDIELPFPCEVLDTGLKYLEFHLKPNSYRNGD